MSTTNPTAAVHRILRNDKAWPLRSVLGKLAEAADTLLDDRDYDGHGWEEIDCARKAAREVISDLPSDLSQYVLVEKSVIDRAFFITTRGGLTDFVPLRECLPKGTPPCRECGGTGVVNEFDQPVMESGAAENWPGPCPQCLPKGTP